MFDTYKIAESEGFEPTIRINVCHVSNVVHSAGLCQLSKWVEEVRYHSLSSYVTRLLQQTYFLYAIVEAVIVW